MILLVNPNKPKNIYIIHKRLVHQVVAAINEHRVGFSSSLQDSRHKDSSQKCSRVMLGINELCRLFEKEIFIRTASPSWLYH